MHAFLTLLFSLVFLEKLGISVTVFEGMVMSSTIITCFQAFLEICFCPVFNQMQFQISKMQKIGREQDCETRCPHLVQNV